MRNGYVKLLSALSVGCASTLEDEAATSLARRDGTLMLERLVNASIVEHQFHCDSNAAVRATTVEVILPCIPVASCLSGFSDVVYSWRVRT